MLTAAAELCYGPRQLVKQSSAPESRAGLFVVCLHCAVHGIHENTERTLLDLSLRMEHVLFLFVFVFGVFFFFFLGYKARGVTKQKLCSVSTDHHYFVSFLLMSHIFLIGKTGQISVTTCTAVTVIKIFTTLHNI